MEIPIAMAVGGGVLSATGSIMKGQQEAGAADFERQQLQIQQQQYKTRQQQLEAEAESIRTAASQAETQRRYDLTSSLETIQAIRAGRGVGSGSPTGMGIFDSIVQHAERDITTERLNYAAKADAARIEGINAGIQSDVSGGAAQMAAQRGKTSLLAGYLQAGADIFKSGSKIYDIDTYGTTRRRV